MNRLTIGVLVLSLLLICSVGISLFFRQAHQPLAPLLEEAAQASLEEDWEKAEALAQSARARWERSYQFTAAFADHEPMEELDSLFAELEVFCHQRENPHFATLCAHIACLARAMADSHACTWWTLL